jgi:hypothetical protein
MKRIYIAGPMRGYKHYNFPAFDAAAERLRRLGFEPVSPADADRALGFDPMALLDDHDWNTLPEGWDIRDVAKRCCDAVIGCDGLFLLSGWYDSRGAVAEKGLADWLRLKVSADWFTDEYVLRDLGGVQC